MKYVDEGWYDGTKKIPSEIMERDGRTTNGMQVPYQGHLEMLMPDGRIACISFCTTTKEQFVKTMASIADVVLFPEEPKT